jgi:hypothetical protein
MDTLPWPMKLVIALGLGVALEGTLELVRAGAAYMRGWLQFLTVSLHADWDAPLIVLLVVAVAVGLSVAIDRLGSGWWQKLAFILAVLAVGYLGPIFHAP